MLQSKEMEYYCTEKSDGVRFLLYVVNTVGLGAGVDGGGKGNTNTNTNPNTAGPRAVFVDRALSFSTMNGASEIGQALGWGTVLPQAPGQAGVLDIRHIGIGRSASGEPTLQ